MLALALALAGLACRRQPAPAPSGPPSCEQRTQEVRHALAGLAGPDSQRVRHALVSARMWLDRIAIDPIALGRQGQLGKRKLSELLNGYYEFWKAASANEREVLRPRIEKITGPLRQREYHDMMTVDRDTFNKESTSYLWTATMMERMGMAIPGYRKSIIGLQDRLDARLLEGGPQVRKILQWHYAYFGLKWPSTVGEPRREFIITIRPDFRGFNRDLIYRLTHEVYALSEYGDALGTDPMDDDELRYTRVALYWLTRTNVSSGETDLVAELASCLRLVRAVDLPVFPEALAHLLESQTPSGAWGHYEPARSAQGEEAERMLQLHTTVVAVQALLLAFHPAWNQNIAARCPESATAGRDVARPATNWGALDARDSISP